jgi:hypothetical protein
MRLFVLIISLVFLSPVFAGDGNFVFAENAKPKAVIVVADGQTNGCLYAARILADTLGRMTGARFMIADEPVKGYSTIRIGEKYEPSRPEELFIKVNDEKTLVITGDGPRGTMHGVSELLERLGVVFCANDFDYVPKIDSPSLPVGFEFRDAPYMQWREACAQLQRHCFDYMMKLRLEPNQRDSRWRLFGKNNRPSIQQTVCMSILPKKKWFKSNPEWFAYNALKNTRNPHWVCVSNSEMFEQLCKDVEARLKSNPEVTEIPLGIDDAYTFCECEKCLELVKSYRDDDGSEHPALQAVVLVNRVAERFAKDYPFVRFNLLAYGDTLPANKKLKFAPNVGAGVAELWRNHGLPADCNERSADCLGEVARMSNEKNGPYIWDYYANFANYIQPFPNHRILAQTMRYYKSLGVKGVYSQHQWPIMGEMSEMKMYLFAKLLWNPEADVGKLIDAYVEAAYGKAAPNIKNYLSILEHARLRQRWTWYGCYVYTTAHYLTDDDCFKIYMAFHNALRAVKGDKSRTEMVQRLRLAAIDLALSRYNDMLTLQSKYKWFKLPSRDSLYFDWRATVNYESRRGSHTEIGEGTMAAWLVERRYPKMFASPPAPTSYPRRKLVIYANAHDLTGGERTVKRSDANGDFYARFNISLGGELGNIFMNPKLAEAGYTIDEKDIGDWYVFGTMRVSSSVELDPAACYMGIYQPYYANGVKLRGTQEIVNCPIPGRKGDESWRTICLGKRRLEPQSRIWLMPGILHESAWCDLKEVFLIAPELFEKGGEGVRVFENGALDRSNKVENKADGIDKFRYTRLSESVKDGVISLTLKPAHAGRYHVFLEVRSGAKKALEQEAAMAEILAPKSKISNAPAKVISSKVISGSLGDESWQIVSLGEVDLVSGMKVCLKNVSGKSNYIDFRRMVLVEPSLISKTKLIDEGEVK